MITRAAIIAEAQSWVGTPYRHQGREKGRAVDCIGLIWGVSRELGLPTPDIPANYMPSPRGSLLFDGCEQYLVRRPTLDRVPGSIAVFWGMDRNTPQHFAINCETAGRVTMVHAFSKRKLVVEHGWDRFWAGRLMYIYDYPGVED